MQEQPYISDKRKFQVEEGILIFLLLLSLATILDGLHIGWCFSLAGLFLGTSAVGFVIVSFIWEYGLNKRAKS